MDTKANNIQARIKELRAAIAVFTSECGAANARRPDFAERITNLNAALRGTQEEIDRLNCRVGHLEASPCEAGMGAQADIRSAALEAALQRIARWHGEFPSAGTWEDGTPKSYGGAFGSNGERDYMRQVALDAIATPSQAIASAEPVTLWIDASEGSQWRQSVGLYDGVEQVTITGATEKWGLFTTPLYTRPATQAAKGEVLTDEQIEAEFAKVYYPPNDPGNSLLQRVYPHDLVKAVRAIESLLKGGGK